MDFMGSAVLNQVPANNIAKRYLVRRRMVDITLEHAKAATFCFRYLTSKPFLLGTDDADAIESHARQGYYGLQDYAVQHALGHFEQYTELDSLPNGSVSHLQYTMEAAGTFLAEYSLPNSLPRDKLTQKDIIDFIKALPLDTRDRADMFTTGSRTITIREHIERIRLQDLSRSGDDEIINNVYGLQVIYKCPRVWCDYFWKGFNDDRDRMRHVQCHDRPFSCAEEGCFASNLGFDTQDKLNDHVRKYHPSSGEQLGFPTTGKRGERKNDTIQDAARRGDLAAVSAFLRSEQTPAKGASRYTTANTPYGGQLSHDPLYQAAKGGHVDICKLLLDKRVSLGWPMNFSSEYVAVAVWNGYPDIIRLFLASPTFQLKLSGTELRRWLHVACERGHLEVVKLLAESPQTGRVILTESTTTESSAHWWGELIRDYGNNQLKWPGEGNNQLGCIKYLLENGFQKGITPRMFFSAERNGWDDLASLLQPIVNLPDFSQRRAEAFLLHHDIDRSLWGKEPFSSIQDQSPQHQWKTVTQWEVSKRQK